MTKAAKKTKAPKAKRGPRPPRELENAFTAKMIATALQMGAIAMHDTACSYRVAAAGLLGKKPNPADADAALRLPERARMLMVRALAHMAEMFPGFENYTAAVLEMTAETFAAQAKENGLANAEALVESPWSILPAEHMRRWKQGTQKAVRP